MSDWRQPGIQPIMSPREQPRGHHRYSWPRGLPSLDGTIRKAPRRPGRPDKEAQCSPCDTGHSPPEQSQPRNEDAWLQMCGSCLRFPLAASLLVPHGWWGPVAWGSLLHPLSLFQSFSPLQQHILQTPVRHPK